MSRIYVLLVGFLMLIIAGLTLASTVAYAQPTGRVPIFPVRFPAERGVK
jgi:hypothetical protein